jgi:hypothetical protein
MYTVIYTVYTVYICEAVVSVAWYLCSSREMYEVLLVQNA